MQHQRRKAAADGCTPSSAGWHPGSPPRAPLCAAPLQDASSKEKEGDAADFEQDEDWGEDEGSATDGKVGDADSRSWEDSSDTNLEFE